MVAILDVSSMTKALKARQELSQWQAASAQPLVQVARIYFGTEGAGVIVF